jgi:phosphoheptose isomerase
MSAARDLHGPGGTPDGAKTGFPAAPYARASKYFDGYAAELARAVSSVDPAAFDRAAGMLADAYDRGARVFSCGNGGSAAIANHLQCDHLKGIRNGTDLSPRVLSLSNNMELLTAIANDLGFDEVFAYQLQSQAAPGDVLIAISSSGRSPNIVRAVSWARENSVYTIALTGFDGGDARRLADVALHADIANYGVIEDLHQSLMHALAQFIRQSRMTPDTIAASTF